MFALEIALRKECCFLQLVSTMEMVGANKVQRCPMRVTTILGFSVFDIFVITDNNYFTVSPINKYIIYFCMHFNVLQINWFVYFIDFLGDCLNNFASV